MRNEFASEHSRAVHPGALKTHTRARSPPQHLTDQQRAHVPSEGKQEAKSTCVWEREVQLHRVISCFSQGRSARQLNQWRAQIHVSGSWTHTTHDVSAQMCDWHALVLAVRECTKYTCTCEQQASLRSRILMCWESKVANVFRAWVKPSGAGPPWNGWSYDGLHMLKIWLLK